ncbi:hypothetical protein TNCV_2098091 [Trichonephila clavipes]|nr:hypothetical protein TNCV_2098091 [Trichonephila clavipes]
MTRSHLASLTESLHEISYIPEDSWNVTYTHSTCHLPVDCQEESSGTLGLKHPDRSQRVMCSSLEPQKTSRADKSMHLSRIKVLSLAWCGSSERGRIVPVQVSSSSFDQNDEVSHQ